MPDTLASLADIVRINDVSVRDAGVSDIFNEAPLLAALFACTASNGTKHSYLKETGAPVVGFRAANVGIDVVTDTDTQVNLDLSYLDAMVKLDKQLAESGKGVDYHLNRKAQRNLRAAFFKAEQQILNGGAGGFNGFAQALGALANPMVVNAAGTANRTSVYAIRTTPEETDVCVVMGNDGEIDIEPYYLTLFTDGSARQFNGYVVPIDGYIGLQVGGARSIARLCNLGTGATLTDVLLQRLFDLFPASSPPTHFVMNTRSRGELQSSRSTINTGTGNRLLTMHATTPTEWNGIPIVCVESLTNAETAVA
jgi:hypothetical protein